LLDQFCEVIVQFVTGSITLEEFQRRYVELWQAALDGFLLETTPEVGIISDLFLEVDTFSYYGKEVGAIPCDTADTLRQAAETALRKLSALETR
jgi:self-protective colicin-like immunity protein